MDQYGNPTTVAEFEAIHGEGIEYRGHVWYADGARRLWDSHGNLGGMSIDPPADPAARQERIVVFHTAKVARAVQQFDQRKAALLNDSDAHNDDGSAMAGLTALRDAVRTAQTELDEAEEALRKANPRYRTKAERDAIDAAVAESKARDDAAREKFRRSVHAMDV